MTCSNCGKNYNIVNKKYGLCQLCNHSRLHPENTQLDEHRGRIFKKEYKPLKRTKIKSTSKTKDKRKEILEKDKATYFIVFSTKKHQCEECRKSLPNKFVDNNGDINAIWQYSHILSKGSHPEYRHNPDNFNRLCMDHHIQWEFGNRKAMKIYEKNQTIIEKLKSFYDE